MTLLSNRAPLDIYFHRHAACWDASLVFWCFFFFSFCFSSMGTFFFSLSYCWLLFYQLVLLLSCAISVRGAAEMRRHYIDFSDFSPWSSFFQALVLGAVIFTHHQLLCLRRSAVKAKQTRLHPCYSFNAHEQIYSLLNCQTPLVKKHLIYSVNYSKLPDIVYVVYQIVMKRV